MLEHDLPATGTRTLPLELLIPSFFGSFFFFLFHT